LNIKLDENLGNRAIELFKEAGHEVITVSEQDLGGATDDELIETCRTEGRVLVTLDLDFSNVLRFLHRNGTLVSRFCGCHTP
jgi:predicted nuclease of predicted toxin-antitoxin system